jgi:hypothetical protein
MNNTHNTKILDGLPPPLQAVRGCSSFCWNRSRPAPPGRRQKATIAATYHTCKWRPMGGGTGHDDAGFGWLDSTARRRECHSLGVRTKCAEGCCVTLGLPPSPGRGLYHAVTYYTGNPRGDGELTIRRDVPSGRQAGGARLPPRGD